MLIFTAPPPKVYGLYIHEDVDIYKRLLRRSRNLRSGSHVDSFVFSLASLPHIT